MSQAEEAPTKGSDPHENTSTSPSKAVLPGRPTKIKDSGGLVTEKQIKRLIKMLDEKGLGSEGEEAILGTYKIDGLDMLTVKQYKQIIERLSRKEGNNETIQK